MAITIKKNKAHFTGKDAKALENLAKEYGMSKQNLFTGMMWEYVMRCAREGMFKGGKRAVYH